MGSCGLVHTANETVKVLIISHTLIRSMDFKV